MVVATRTYLDRRRSARIEERIVGVWTESARDTGGDQPLWIWDFRADGTLREHPAGKPLLETGRVDDYPQWQVAEGALIVRRNRRFARNAAPSQWFRQAWAVLVAAWRGTPAPSDRVDRYTIAGEVGETLTLVFTGDGSDAAGDARLRVTLSRSRPE